MTPRRRVLITAIAPQAAVAAGAVTWFAANLSRLPDPVATHFDAGGAADGWSSPATTLWGFIGLLALMLVPAVAFTVGGLGSTGAVRPLAGLWSGLTIALALLIPATTAPQLDLDDATGLALGSWPLLWPWLVGAAAGAPIALLTRPLPAADDDAPSAEPVRLGARDRAAWFGSATAPRWVIGVVAGIVAVCFATTVPPVLAAGTGDHVRVWAIIAVLLPVLPLLAALSRITVRIGARGISWSYFPGIRRPGLRWGDVEEVSAGIIRPGDYGGWGWRRGVDGSTAILIRGGEALRIARHGKPDLWITVDDAARGAELARAYLRRG